MSRISSCIFRQRSLVLGSVLIAGIAAAPGSPADSAAGRAGLNVTTYHYDNLRTGWDSKETALTPNSVASSKFKMLVSVSLDDQADAQPLVVTNQKIKGKGIHDVVYIATESDTIYALDAATGDVLAKQNFGPPVPFTALPGQCDNNGPNVGITSTPVIDTAAGVMYAMVYTFRNSRQAYHLHKISLSTLKDAAKPVEVSASAKLADGSTYRFDPSVSRQRPALLLANGNIYAGFGSFCDLAADKSRGWMLGWNAASLAPLPANELTVTRTHSPNNFFLTAIWMSGYGPAAGLDGDIYFITGNSDPSGTTFDPKTNIDESVVQLSGDLMTVKSLFTPKGPDVGWQQLDKIDEDFGSGGALLLPPQYLAPNLLIGLGKAGKMYLLNADDLTNGGLKGNAKALDIVDAGSCWCGQTYYQGSDGIGRVVSGGGNVVRVWKVKTSPRPKLEQQSASESVQNGQDPGVFTVVSSNGTHRGTAVVWALGRPTDFHPGNFKLYAFDAEKGSTLFTANAGVWNNPDNNAALVPVVANGRVYVASNGVLSIFGLGGGPAAKLAPARPLVDMRAKLAANQHEVFGTVRKVQGSAFIVQKRDGTALTVDASRARMNSDLAQPAVGRALSARGTYEASGVLKAIIVKHAKSNPAMWYADR